MANETLTDLRSLLKTGDHNAAQPIALLLAGYRAKAADAGSTIAAYMIAVDGLPNWAVRDAVKDFLQGATSEDPQFIPAPGVVARRARAYLIGVNREITRLERLLSARVIPTRKPKEATHGASRS